MIGAKMKQVTRKEFCVYVMEHANSSDAFEGQQVSVMQHLRNGCVIAQAVYRKGLAAKYLVN